jgi:hypothetical protein
VQNNPVMPALFELLNSLKFLHLCFSILGISDNTSLFPKFSAPHDGSYLLPSVGKRTGVQWGAELRLRLRCRRSLRARLQHRIASWVILKSRVH